MDSDLMEDPNNYANLPPNLAVLKMENDNIAAMAVARPRDLGAIKEELITQLREFPVFAQAAVYSKPVGKDPGGKMKFARGLSVRAAEALLSCYGFCNVRTSAEPAMSPSGKEGATVTASFTDLQKGTVWRDSTFVSRWYNGRNGSMREVPEDRFWNVTVKAAASKSVREVILRSIPPGMKMELLSIAEKAMAESLTDDEMQNIISEFEKVNVSLAMLESLLQKPFARGWSQEDRVTLKSAYAALRDKETTFAELFEASDEAEDGKAEADALTDQIQNSPTVTREATSEEIEAAKATEPKPKTEKPKSNRRRMTTAVKETPKEVTQEPSSEAVDEAEARAADAAEGSVTVEPEKPDTEASTEKVDGGEVPKDDGANEKSKAYGFLMKRIDTAKGSKALETIRNSADTQYEGNKISSEEYSEVVERIGFRQEDFDRAG